MNKRREAWRRSVVWAEFQTARYWRRAVLARAVDVTQADDQRSCLVVAPHPDDETFGCGALMARKRAAGARVDVVVLTDGARSHAGIAQGELAKLRNRELKDACATVGLERDHLHALGLSDRSLSKQTVTVAREVARLVRMLEPDDVFVTSLFDGHPDHVAASEAVREALASLPGPRLLEYPVWSWYRGPLVALEGRRRTARRVLEAVANLVFPPPAQTVSMAGFRDVKAKAVSAYATQLEDQVGDGSWAAMPEGFVELFLHSDEVFFPQPVRPRRDGK